MSIIRKNVREFIRVIYFWMNYELKQNVKGVYVAAFLQVDESTQS